MEGQLGRTLCENGMDNLKNGTNGIKELGIGQKLPPVWGIN